MAKIDYEACEEQPRGFIIFAFPAANTVERQEPVPLSTAGGAYSGTRHTAATSPDPLVSFALFALFGCAFPCKDDIQVPCPAGFPLPYEVVLSLGGRIQ